MMEISDIDLIKGIANRDSEALKSLFARYGRRCFALCYRIVESGPAAEEIVQDTFETVWNKCGQFDSERGTNVRGWLLTIAHRKSIDYRRRELDRRPPSLDIDDLSWALAVPDAWSSVEQTLLQERVRAALSELPEEQRQVIEMAYFEGLSQSDIARDRDIPLGTVKGRMRLGLKKLAESLRDEREPHGNDSENWSTP